MPLARVVGWLALVDVKDFGLAWDDCEALLKSLGFTAKVEIAAASIAHAAGVADHAGECRRDVQPGWEDGTTAPRAAGF